jgi:hypothetical protein
LDALESGHAEHEETLEEHEEATEAVEASAESAQRMAMDATDTAYRVGDGVQETAAIVAADVAEVVAAEVAEEVAEEVVEEIPPADSDVTEIVEGEPATPPAEPEPEHHETPPAARRKRPFGRR